MNNADTLKISIAGKRYKNEIRVDISEMEQAEVLALASEIVKTMLDDSKKMPESE